MIIKPILWHHSMMGTSGLNQITLDTAQTPMYQDCLLTAPGNRNMILLLSSTKFYVAPSNHRKNILYSNMLFQLF